MLAFVFITSQMAALLSVLPWTRGQGLSQSMWRSWYPKEAQTIGQLFACYLYVWAHREDWCVWIMFFFICLVEFTNTEYLFSTTHLIYRDFSELSWSFDYVLYSRWLNPQNFFWYSWTVWSHSFHRVVSCFTSSIRLCLRDMNFLDIVNCFFFK